jgi:hypothetical protein
MNLESFMTSLSSPNPPAELNDYLLSLWYDGKGDWSKAHKIIQDIEDENGSWIHAYLHRKEGDVGNADYWYRKAGRSRPGSSLKEEWTNITAALLENYSV